MNYNTTQSPFNTYNITLFQPNQISNLALWLDAADTTTITLSGTNVTQWKDKSGKTTTTVISQPSLSGKYINNYQTLRFNNNQMICDKWRNM